MRRGPEPAKGFDVAIPVAHARGRVILFRSSPWYVGDFLIMENGRLTMVRVRMARRLYATIEEISSYYCDAITGLGTVPCEGPVSRELWLYSRRGALRFFRIGTDGLVEIDRQGVLLVTENQTGIVPAIPGNTSPAPSGPALTGKTGAGVVDPRGPILRWLAKKNAGKKPVAGKTNATSPANPPNNADADNGEPDGIGQGPASEPVTSADHAPAESPAGLPLTATPSPEQDTPRIPGERRKGV